MHKIFLFIFLFICSCSVNSDKNEFRIFNKYKKNKKYSQAIMSLDKIVLKTNSHQYKKKALLERADIYLNHIDSPNDLIKTYRDLSKITELNSEKFNFLFLASEVYVNKLKNTEAAIVILNELKKLKITKYNPKLYLKIAEVYYQKKDYYQSDVLLKKLLKLKLNDKIKFKAETLQAELLYKLKKVESAIGNYTSLISDYPYQSKINGTHFYLLGLYESENSIENAVKLINEMIEIYPEKKSYLMNKLNRLKEMMINIPGAKGLRR